MNGVLGGCFILTVWGGNGRCSLRPEFWGVTKFVIAAAMTLQRRSGFNGLLPGNHGQIPVRVSEGLTARRFSGALLAAQVQKKHPKVLFYRTCKAGINAVRVQRRKSPRAGFWRGPARCCCRQSTHASRGHRWRCAGLPRHDPPDSHALNWRGPPTADC